MIFVTVGSHAHLRFDRLLDALGALDGAELVVQHGPGRAPAGVARAMPFMRFGEVVRTMQAAERVICHAGVGSIVCARRAGHTPVVVPRLARFGETVDDHQVELAEALGRTGEVIAVLDTGGLAAAVARAPARGGHARAGDGAIQRAVECALLGVP